MYEVGNRTEQTRDAVYILSRHCEMNYLHPPGNLFNLAKMVVSALHKKLAWKVEKLKYKKLEVIPPRIKTSNR